MLDLSDAARALAPHVGDAGPLRGAAAATWRARMVNEYSSHEVFLALGDQAVACGFGDSVQRECLRFADEERMHGALCGAAAVAFGEEAIAARRPGAAFPQHASAPLRSRLLRNLISVCCMSETVAVALIGAEQMEMPDSPLRELLTRIYADEVGHARFGWQVLHGICARLDTDERAAIDRYLPLAFAHLEAHELAHLPALGAPPGGEAYGLCSGLDARDLLYDTIEQIIVPQLDAMGFRATIAWASAGRDNDVMRLSR
jgi:hypothetical protein